MAEARIGTAGWSIPLPDAAAFPVEGSGLERYAARLRCAEINSSFHRSHRPSTWRRWAESVPDDFRFSAKLPKTITHGHRLIEAEKLLDAFVEESSALGAKLAILLVQLPPSLVFDATAAAIFFRALRSRTATAIACEPRHASWFSEDADDLLGAHRVARVAADPAKVGAAALPGGWRDLSYFRLHGSPVPYRSSYDADRLQAYARAMAAGLGEGREVWCIFDNTASSAAMGNALDLERLLLTQR